MSLFHCADIVIDGLQYICTDAGKFKAVAPQGPSYHYIYSSLLHFQNSLVAQMVNMSVCFTLSVISDPLLPHGLYQNLLCMWNSPGKNTGMGCHFLLQMVKNLPAIWETWVWSLGPEDSLEKEVATHSSILAWKIPRTEEPSGLQSTGSQRVGHDWATSLSLQFHRKKSQFPLRMCLWSSKHY